MEINTLIDYTGQLLDVSRFRDYCPNGLQVEGRPEVFKIVSGVSASLELLEAAANTGADAILVHHGWFWKSDALPVTGVRRRRLQFLLSRDINLLAYHLPLDAHVELGNNAQLARVLGFELQGCFGEQNVGAVGCLGEPLSLAALGRQITVKLGREPLLIGELEKTVRRIAWCTGAAQDYLPQAVALGVDAFLTGEVSEHTVHLSRESGVAFIAAGHHATERYGVQALGQHLAKKFGIEHEFIDLHNPV